MSADAADPLRLLSLRQAAGLMGVRDDVVRGLVERRELASHRFGANYYVTRVAIEAYYRRVAETAYGTPEPRPGVPPRRIG